MNNFLEKKILNGIFQSAQKRPVSSDDIEQVVSRIEQKVRSEYESEVPSTVIGNLVMDELAELDEITYVRFASVYKSFKDVDEIRNFCSKLRIVCVAKRKEVSMRPIDEFSYVKNNKVLSDSDSLSQLYHPVIGNHACAFV